MEILKWIASTFAALISVSLVIIGGLLLAVFGAVFSYVLIGGLIVVLIAAGIKEYFDGPETKR